MWKILPHDIASTNKNPSVGDIVVVTCFGGRKKVKITEDHGNFWFADFC